MVFPCSFFRVPERVMFIGTLFTMALGLIVWIPYGPGHPDVQIVGREMYCKQHVSETV